jgi:hypothetical protein
MSAPAPPRRRAPGYLQETSKQDALEAFIRRVVKDELKKKPKRHGKSRTAA